MTKYHSARISGNQNCEYCGGAGSGSHGGGSGGSCCGCGGGDGGAGGAGDLHVHVHYCWERFVFFQNEPFVLV